MGNIVIKEILASDTVSNLVDKINFNFDQLLLNGGGPIGLTGTQGPSGPLGPRGTVWFTSGDIYNTSLTTTPAPPLLFPLWSGSPQKVNNTALPGYPQFKGDPNKYLPVATPATPNTYPYFSFTIGTTGKLPKSGDLYLQETDDIFNAYSSKDGDIWEFNSVANTWTFTGVNIKGDTGSTGSTGATEWIRTTDTGIIDALHPYVVTGQNPAVRVLVGTDDTTVIEETAGAYTQNVMTIYRDTSSATGYNLAFTDNSSILAPAVSTADYANITTTGNILGLSGFNSNLTDAYGVYITAPAGSLYFQAQSPILPNNIDVTLDLAQRKLQVVNAAIDVSCAPGVNPTGDVIHRFSDTEVTLNIFHNPNNTYTGWANKFIRLQTLAVTGVADLILSDTTSIDSRIGIGEWVTGKPSAKFTISNSGFPSVPAVSVGNSWSNSSTTTFTHATVNSQNIQNSVYLAGMLTIGATNTFSFPTIFGSSNLNSLSTANGIGIKRGLLTFNAYSDNDSFPGLRSMGTSNYGNYAFGHGAFLSTFILANSADLTNDTFVLSSSNSVVSVQGTTLTGGLQGNQPFNINMFLKSNTKQFGFNTTFNSGNADFNSRGGAVFGKIKSYTGESFFGHEDAQANKNIILGWPKDYSSNNSNSPRIVVTSPLDTNLIYLTTPSWSGSMKFDSSVGPLEPTIRSFTSSGTYVNYFPSTYAQNKLINGINYPVITSQLGFDSNPYDTGIGLEIETRVNLTSGTSTGDIRRTPVTSYFSGGTPNNYIKGNRPLLITKRDNSNVVQVLLEVSPTNNVAVGGAIKYPSDSVLEVYRAVTLPPSTNVIDAMGYAPDSSLISSAIGYAGPYLSPWNTTYSVNSVSGNSNAWSVAIPHLSTFVTGDYDRALHINTIYPNNNTQNNVDQHVGKVKAGIVISTEAISNSSSIAIIPALGYQQYAESLFKSYHQVTTSPLMINYNSSAPTGVKAALPLGVKPGPVTFYKGSSTATFFTKGADLVLSAGDFLYQYNSTGQFPIPTVPPKAGDVFITGGQMFRSVINENGLDAAKVDVGTATSSIEKRNFGNIYIGSNITPADITLNSNSLISKTSPVYIGYQSNDTAVFSADLTSFSPKGTASLNIAAPSDSVLNDLTTEIKPTGKALNIQKGDIVTANQEAGWVEIDLTSASFISGVNSLCISSATQGGVLPDSPSVANQKARYVAGSGINPRWIVSYKVIGYTVFYKFELQSVLFSTGGTNDSPYIYVGSDNLFSTTTGVNSGKLPRPKLITTSAVYTGAAGTGQYSYFNPLSFGTVYSPSFLGNGYVTIRQNRANTYPIKPPWPYIVAGGSQELIRVPINAGIITVGQVWIQLMGIGAGTYMFSDPGNYDVKEEIQGMLDANYKKLVPFAGNYIVNNGTGNVGAGVEIQLDIVFSGQYELDPQYWFV
jgi:hypothetical protein